MNLTVKMHALHKPPWERRRLAGVFLSLGAAAQLGGETPALPGFMVSMRTEGTSRLSMNQGVKGPPRLQRRRGRKPEVVA
jgi:hypothetical protein